ncbi:growth factor receptor-bound protein 14 [Leptonychotes weddellii]|uniref:Growth factor receptor-bound protein 14 n=1 Tax=Leptonychotes weddellii TaxID=9713 RepID=A0A7F8RKY4_LEPWE|nr:growth factor receptor-bound protein 14 [Leptonychotes weddellii]
MTTSLQDGQSAAGRAAAQDSPLAAQVCGAAQGRGDARDLEPAPWLHARALLPPPDGTRGCAADRRKKKDLDVLEMPSIPNPFPELCCSPFTSVLSAGLFPKANSRKKQVIKVYSEDETSRALEVPSDITARDVCQLLILKNHYIDDHSWTLFEHLPHIGLVFFSPQRSISENSLVAMDFSGQKSRVIENPTEALSVAVEEGLAWRKKGCLRLATHGSPTASSQSSATNMAIHRSQPWFHHKISRDEAQRLIIQQGLVDGVFLVRDSQSNPKTFVLSMSHGQKIKHFQIIPVEDDGELFHTLDDGHTRFTDLIQLVEFYQLNKGVLPCKLKHYCARIAL